MDDLFLSFNEKSVDAWLCEKGSKKCVCACVFLWFLAPTLLNYGWIVTNKQNRWDAAGIILTTNGVGRKKIA